MGEQRDWLLLGRAAGEKPDWNYIDNVLPQHPRSDHARATMVNRRADRWLAHYEAYLLRKQMRGAG